MSIKSLISELPVSNLLSIIAGTVGMLVAYFTMFESVTKFEIGDLGIKIEQIDATKNINSEIVSLRADLKQVKDNVDSLTKIPEDSKAGIQLKQIQAILTDLQTRQGKLEAVILTNPAKALEIPLLQRDLENVKAQQQVSVLTMKESIDRIYDLNKWLLGAMAVSIVTLALSNFLKGKESENQSK